MNNYAVIHYTTVSETPLKNVAFSDFFKQSKIKYLTAQFKDCGVNNFSSEDDIKYFSSKLVNFAKHYPIIVHNPTINGKIFQYYDFQIFKSITKVKIPFIRNFIFTDLMSSYTGGPVKIKECAITWNLHSSIKREVKRVKEKNDNELKQQSMVYVLSLIHI